MTNKIWVCSSELFVEFVLEPFYILFFKFKTKMLYIYAFKRQTYQRGLGTALTLCIPICVCVGGVGGGCKKGERGREA